MLPRFLLTHLTYVPVGNAIWTLVLGCEAKARTELLSRAKQHAWAEEAIADA